MLSRERLSIAVQDPSPYRPEDAEEMIDAFAHELAEKIRADQEIRLDNSLRGTAFTQGMRYAADLIDPEVES